MVPKHFGEGVQLVHLDAANTFHPYQVCSLYALVSSTLPYVQPSPPLREKITGRGADFPIFSWVEGTAVHKLSDASIFAVMIRSSYRSRNVLLVMDLTERWYNVGKQKQNWSHSLVFGEVTSSLFSWKCTCINLLWVYIDFFLSSLEGVQTPVGDLHNPMTVNHTPRWRQVSMEPDSSVVKVLHSLEWKRNIPVINLKHQHRLKSGILISYAFLYLILFDINFMCANSYPDTTF